MLFRVGGALIGVRGFGDCFGTVAFAGFAFTIDGFADDAFSADAFSADAFFDLERAAPLCSST